MSIAKVKSFFGQYGMEDRILEFDVSSETVELASKALGCEPGMIAKTLSFLVEEKAVLVVAAGDVKIDNHKYKEQFHTKARMLTPDQAVEMTGHAVGGVCPFVVNPGVEVYLDQSLKKYQTVYPACGSGNSGIGLSIEEMEKYSGYRCWVDVCKSV